RSSPVARQRSMIAICTSRSTAGAGVVLFSSGICRKLSGCRQAGECAHVHNPATAGSIGPRGNEPRQPIYVFHLQGETADRVASETVETSRDEDQVRLKIITQSVERSFECLDVLHWVETGCHWRVEYGAVWPVVGCRASPGVEGPLMHGQESDAGIVLHQRLRTIAVMHVPVDDQDPIEVVDLASVVRAQRDASEDAETHRAVADCVVTGRPNARETPGRAPVDRHVDRVEHAAGRGRRGIPGTFTGNSVDVEAATTSGTERSN